jgi:hypothetical protein
MSFKEIVEVRPPIGSRRTIWKELMRGHKEKEYRKEPPEIGPGHRGRWHLNLLRASRASKSFDRARSRFLEAASKVLPREDAPIKTQAQELADLLFALSLHRSLSLMELLTKALEVETQVWLKTTQAFESKDRGEALNPRDVAAIRSFIGRSGHIDEAFDDPALLLLLDHRKAASKALEIFRSRLNDELRELDQGEAGRDGGSVVGGRPRARAQPHTREGAEGARLRRTDEGAERAAARRKKVRAGGTT